MLKTVKKEIDEILRLTGRGKNARFRGKIPRIFRQHVSPSPSEDLEVFLDDSNIDGNNQRSGEEEVAAHQRHHRIMIFLFYNALKEKKILALNLF